MFVAKPAASGPLHGSTPTLFRVAVAANAMPCPLHVFEHDVVPMANASGRARFPDFRGLVGQSAVFAIAGGHRLAAASSISHRATRDRGDWSRSELWTSARVETAMHDVRGRASVKSRCICRRIAVVALALIHRVLGDIASHAVRAELRVQRTRRVERRAVRARLSSRPRQSVCTCRSLRTCRSGCTHRSRCLVRRLHPPARPAPPTRAHLPHPPALAHLQRLAGSMTRASRWTNTARAR